MTDQERWEKRQSLFEQLQDEDMRHTLALSAIEIAYHEQLAAENRQHGETVEGIKAFAESSES